MLLLKYQIMHVGMPLHFSQHCERLMSNPPLISIEVIKLPPLIPVFLE